ncbi:MAG: hypothetical protein ABIY55_15870 [Kofleriaceae bacterium]
MADDDRALMERLAALEAEVTADAEAQSARKAAAVAKLRDQRVTQTAERDQLRARQAELVSERKKPARDEPRRARREVDADEADQLEGLGGALELATKANRVKNELSRTPRKGDKSWIASGVASLALGPVGWLYAGSLREAVPAATATMLLAAIASKILPVILLWPALMVVMPLSAIAGVVYALQYNRAGGRQRLFEGDKAKAKAKQLRGG